MNGIITTVVGTGKAGFFGDGGLAQLKNPVSSAFDAAGNLYIADFGNWRCVLNCSAVETDTDQTVATLLPEQLF